MQASFSSLSKCGYTSLPAARICLLLSTLLLATAGVQTLKKKTSKLKISALTNVITIFNMPVNIDEGEQ